MASLCLLVFQFFRPGARSMARFLPARWNGWWVALIWNKKIDVWVTCLPTVFMRQLAFSILHATFSLVHGTEPSPLATYGRFIFYV